MVLTFAVQPQEQSLQCTVHTVTVAVPILVGQQTVWIRCRKLAAVRN